MPHLTLQVSPQGRGPLIDVQIGVSAPRRLALTAAKQPVPAPIIVRALIDTGASLSAIDPFHLSALGVAPSGNAAVQTPSTGDTPHNCNTFDVAVLLPHQGIVRTWDPVAVIGVPLRQQGIDMLFGRDLLWNCLLVYDGGANIFQLSL